VRRLIVAGVVGLLGLQAGVAAAAPHSDGSTPAPPRIVQLVTHVPASALNQVGAGDIGPPQVFQVTKVQQDLRSHGKPELLTMNFAWCPHCAANSWALAIALSRFGTLSGLGIINTGTYYCKLTHDPCSLAPSSCYPFTHGLSFFSAGYRSPYLSFKAIVLQDVHGRNLEKPTRRENADINQFDSVGGTPAVDVGGAYGFLNSGYDPGALIHKTWSQIAGSLAKPHNEIARHIDGTANLFTAAICTVTKGRPADVCKSQGVLAAAPRLDMGPGPPPGPMP
jgi:hypothetical protein